MNVGYRWFDKEKIEPLFAFGHGLSYTTFRILGPGRLTRPTMADSMSIVNIKNTGSVDSDEVPQVYLGAPSHIPDGVQFPVRALVAFDRIHLEPGESEV